MGFILVGSMSSSSGATPEPNFSLRSILKSDTRNGGEVECTNCVPGLLQMRSNFRMLPIGWKEHV